MSVDEDTVTLKDVETAIKILVIFLKRQRQSETLLRRIGMRGRTISPFGLNFEDILRMSYEQVQARKMEKEEEIEELSEEELERIRKIADKVKAQR